MPKVPLEKNSLRSFGQSQQPFFQLKQDYGVLCWNVFKSKKKNWATDFKRLHATYDILLLQEAKINFNISPIDNFDPEYSWVFGESFSLNKCGSSCGVLTGTRTLETHAINKHTRDREPLINTPKSIAFSFYAIEESPHKLLIINAHFINFRTTKAFQKQLEQVAEVLTHHQGPTLFAGDFNTWSKGRMDSLERMMSNYDLAPVIFPNESRQFLVLDHIFTRGLLIKDAHLLHDIQSSDHIPLTLWFEIQ